MMINEQKGREKKLGSLGSKGGVGIMVWCKGGESMWCKAPHGRKHKEKGWEYNKEAHCNICSSKRPLSEA